MEIKLPHMPFKFNTPDGQMEVTVRSGALKSKIETRHLYAAAAIFIQHGPKALERIQLTPNVKTHGEVMKTLLTGFAVNPDKHDQHSIEHRILSALCKAKGVQELDN
jgi:hypothetical protein